MMVESHPQAVQGRNIMLDICRVTAVLVVFMFHTSLALGIDYGPFREVAAMGATFMSFFFQLSGYTLYYVHGRGGKLDVQYFFMRRAVSIMPAYLVATAVAIMLVGELRGLELIALVPIYGLALQSTNLGFMLYFPNSGTWFVSCIMVCYFICPLLFFIVAGSSRRTKFFLLLVCYSLVSYVSAVRHFLAGINSIYYNPFYRGLEFFSGILIADFAMGTAGRAHADWRMLAPALTAEAAAVYLSITALVRLGVGIGDYMAYTVVLVPLFGAILFTQGLAKCVCGGGVWACREGYCIPVIPYI